jgi:hypothetical protein
MSSTVPASSEPPAFELTPTPGPGDVQDELFGPVADELTLADVKRAIRGVSRPRDLRPLVQKSDHDPLLNMLELAMKAKNAGEFDKAFQRFAECLPYVWTRVNGQGIAGLGDMPPGSAGQVTYAWMSPTEPQP